jgi:hypothetical protein
VSARAAVWIGNSIMPSANYKGVLTQLALAATDKGARVGVEVPEGCAVTWQANEVTAHRAQVSEKTVRRVVADAEARGIVRRERRYVRNPRWDEPGQPPKIRTTDLVWFDTNRAPYITPEDETAHASKARAGKRGGVASAQRRAAQQAAAALADVADQSPQAPALRGHLLGGSEDICLGAQRTLGVRAIPSSDPPVTGIDHSRDGTTDRTREPVENPESSAEVTTAAAAPSAEQPAAPVRLSSDEIRARALGYSRGRRPVLAAHARAADHPASGAA